MRLASSDLQQTFVIPLPDSLQVTSLSLSVAVAASRVAAEL